jgi:hypothetical protein
VGEFSTTFDEFEHPILAGADRQFGTEFLALWVQTGLRGLSFGALWLAILTASFLIVRHALLWICGGRLANVLSGFSWDWHL